MMCDVILGLCIVGGMQTSPDKYTLEILDANNRVHSVVLNHYEPNYGSGRSSKPALQGLW